MRWDLNHLHKTSSALQNCSVPAEQTPARLARVFIFLVQERPSARSKHMQTSLAHTCNKVLVDTLAALLQGGVPVLYNAHIFGPHLIGCASFAGNVCRVNPKLIDTIDMSLIMHRASGCAFLSCHGIMAAVHSQRSDSLCCTRTSNKTMYCRLTASATSSTALSDQADNAVCAILEADAEALQEANASQEVVSIDLDSSAHYCSPVFWKARIPLLIDQFTHMIKDSLPAGSVRPS